MQQCIYIVLAKGRSLVYNRVEVYIVHVRARTPGHKVCTAVCAAATAALLRCNIIYDA